MGDWRTTDELHDLTEQLAAMSSAVVSSTDIAAPDLRTVLKFVNKVVQLVDEAFQDVYVVLVDISLLDDDDLGTDRVKEARRSLALLTAKSKYRDAEEICSRLHHLTDDYREHVGPIVQD